MFFDLDSDFSWPFDFFGDGFEIFFGLSSVSLFSPSLNPSPSCFSFDSTFSDFGFDDLDGDTDPDAVVVAHPECTEAVRDLADMVCSTELMVEWSRQQKADTLIVTTESGMIHRLRREVPNKTFVAAPTDRCACNECRFMKMNTLQKVRDCLKNGTPEITLPEAVRVAAEVPLRRMLEWSR